MQKKVNLISHFGHHGIVAVADANPSINVTWIIECGEWMMDRISTAFEYIFGNSRNDRKVAHVLAGWPNGDAVVYTYNPNHLVVSTLIERVRSYDLGIKDLHAVGKILFQAFQRHNLGHLALEDCPSSISTQLRSLTEVALESRVEINQQINELRREAADFRLESEKRYASLQAEVVGLKEVIGVLVNCLDTSTSHEISASASVTAANDSHVLEGPGGIEGFRTFPSHLVKLGDLLIVAAYYEYVGGGLSNCVTANKQECKALSDLRQLCTLARELDPSFLSIPDPPAFHREQFRTWRDRVKPLIQHSTVELYKKIDKHHELTKVSSPNSRKRRATNKAMASLKRMRIMARLDVED
ncbi:hypothetical protein R1flu_016667 [Riccia fluitans]|uniref:Uncharacterized protein n=1 Tax=Riccia fluitans TaxID=41844 RepID=A0ABD1YMH6_9MARC